MPHEVPKIDYPDHITLRDERQQGRDLRLEKRIDPTTGVVYYSTKLDWRDPDKE